CRRTCSSGPSLLSSQPVPTSLWQSGTRVQDLFGTSRYRNGMDRGSRRRDTDLRPTWRVLALIESALGVDEAVSVAKAARSDSHSEPPARVRGSAHNARSPVCQDRTERRGHVVINRTPERR